MSFGGAILIRAPSLLEPETPARTLNKVGITPSSTSRAQESLHPRLLCCSASLSIKHACSTRRGCIILWRTANRASALSPSSGVLIVLQMAALKMDTLLLVASTWLAC